MAERILILFLIILCPLLSGCVSKFDNAAYIRLVDATALLSPDVCSDPKKVLHTITDFRSKIDWLVLCQLPPPKRRRLVPRLLNRKQ